MSYPLPEIKKEREILDNDFLPNNYDFIRFGLKSKQNMFIQCLCFLTIREYRKTKSEEEKLYMIKSLKNQMINFIKQESKFSVDEVSRKLIQKTKSSLTERTKTEIHLPDNKSIIGSYFSFQEYPGKGYPFFTNLEDIKPNSNLFVLNDYNNVSNFMTARVEYRYEKNKLLDIEKLLTEEKVNCEYALSKTETYKGLKGNMERLNPINLIDTISNNKNFEYDDEEFKSFCSILKFNICILRAWSDNVSVENYYYPDPSFPTLCIFEVREGKYGISGDYTETKYNPGGIVYKEKVKYYLDSEEDELLIFQLLKYNSTDNSKILEGNYRAYLMGNKNITQMDKIDIPEYGKLKNILSNEGDLDQIDQIVKDLDLA